MWLVIAGYMVYASRWIIIYAKIQSETLSKIRPNLPPRLRTASGNKIQPSIYTIYNLVKYAYYRSYVI